MSESHDPFSPPDPDDARRRREYSALFRITERHAAHADRRRWDERRMPMEPLDAVRRVADLAGGSRIPEPDEPPVDASDVTAALSLLPRVRADIDALESGLLQMARGRGMTWQEIAFGLGLGSPQAARQRHERLTGRVEPADASDTGRAGTPGA
ncbi:DNA-binding protein [Marinitenerispora sediminis]|uniref:DNA-binding protein n=1 Tax=Marinitenerispora sediminis TaxID=1931232 RepID=A0A368SZZ1_9ACTN|nr:DNA-binding protein [Marinitenerispora sediminis]RCV51447.1 DNA-binding protein [Marinitenerispora sediminis]RCV51907.1 DNA-binding protein [Marinitenerispora sediminis]RCV55246.1 DNA-binding protein [Marinitenerispora sediminis]